ncbi:MAG: MlaD family protein [Verrucomicrobiia bacterium]
MSKKINTTTIGLFIVTGVALGVTGLLIFSSSKLFSPTRECIVYFDTSLNGLNEGAPVKYRGVTIGSVKRVMVQFNQATNDYSMPVIIELEEKLLRDRLGADSSVVFSESAIAQRIKTGLRASLQTESLVTGILYIDIRLDPDAPPPVFHELEQVYLELPTEPTQIQELMNNLASLDIKSIENNLNALLTKLDTTVGSLQMAQINEGITNLLISVDRFVSSPELTNDLAAVRTTLDQYRLLGEKLNSRIDPLADSITNSLTEASRALGQIRGAAENLRTLLAPDSPERNNLDQALQQLAGASESISALAEFLKQHPNALITGREILPQKP